jgi:hypothetical protein
VTRIVPIVLVALFLVLRLVQLQADPPRSYPNGRSTQELVVEGPAKANEARRYGLFGTFETKPENQYRIWRVQSPVYVLPLSRFFRVFGTGRAPLRVFGALAGALGLLALFAIGRRHSQPLVAPIACATYALSFYDIQLTRGALIEPYLNAVLAAAFLCGLLALQRLPWLLLAQLLFAAALLTKQTALFATPALFALGVCAHLAAKRRGAPVQQHALSVGLGLGLAAALLAYVSSRAYWQTVEWNAGHMLAGVEARRSVSAGLIDVGAVLGRIGNAGRWHEILFYTVPLAPFALLQIGRVVLAFAERRAVEPVDWVASAWLISALLVLQLTMHVRPRFSIIVLPPAALLAASFIAFATTRMQADWRRYAPIAVAALIALCTDVRWQAREVGRARYDLQHAAAQLAPRLDAHDVVIGSAAPVLAFDSRADLFYVRKPFNVDRKALGALGVTHLLLRADDGSGARFAKQFRARFDKRKKLVKLRALGESYTLYSVPKQSAPKPKK